MIYYFSAQIFLRPLFGYISDAIGHRGVFLMVATLLQMIAFMVFMFYPYCSVEGPCLTPVVIGMIILCIGSAMLQIIWACFSIVIENEIMGTAWGVLFCIENFAAMIFPIV